MSTRRRCGLGATGAAWAESRPDCVVRGKLRWVTHEDARGPQLKEQDDEIQGLRQQLKLMASQTEEVIVDGITSAAHAEEKRRQGKPVRLYMDGCFDMTHFGCVAEWPL